MAKENALTKLKRDIKENKISSLYLFYGEEVYLKELYIKKLMALVPDDGFSEFNKITIDGAEASLFDISDAFESFPVMADKKIVLINGSNIFKAASADEKEFYLKRFENLSDDTTVIFNEAEVDRRGALFKSASKHGETIEFAYLSETDLISFVIREVMSRGRTIDKGNAEYLVNICDNGLSGLKNEILKLTAGAGGEIMRSDIDKLASKSLQIQVFELCDCLMEKNSDRVLMMLRDLRTVKESPFKLLYILLGTFDKMLKAKLMAEDGMTYQEISTSLGVSPFIAKKYINGAKGFSREELIIMTAGVAEADLSIKQGRTDEWTALEELVFIPLKEEKK